MILTYDIRGIQKAIFSVPRLRCIIGTSETIAEFDGSVKAEFGERCIYAGGGGGAIELTQDEIDPCIETLTQRSQGLGLDLRIGTGDSLSEAKSKDRLYPFVPPASDGPPCAISGLYPVGTNDAWKKQKDVHHIIGARMEAGYADRCGGQLAEKLKESIASLLQDAQSHEAFQMPWRFFKNVTTETSDIGEDNRDEAIAGSNALGGRNRWAVVAMDGNDAGNQHLRAQKLVDEGQWDPDSRDDWTRRMSGHLRTITLNSFVTAASSAMLDWIESDYWRDSIVSNGQGTHLVLPLRPLIIGGDDIVTLIAPDMAFDFVTALSRQFATEASDAGASFESETGRPLWPATGNRLTISAGILLVKTTYPLHSAIAYAERLLASAKGSFRGKPDSPDGPTPAAVDFDIVTDTMLDTPEMRRRRELTFHDDDLNRVVHLTQRPYRIESCADGAKQDEGVETIDDLQAMTDDLFSDPEKLPGSVAADLLQVMTRPWSSRVQYLVSLKRKYPNLVSHLNEENPSKTGRFWKADAQEQSTSFIDALLLAEHRHRIAQGPN
ncbi:Cas10/Cmr2 second palm domain-containing protein [Aporhodopirellula aestuarii]|uniref:Cas10/Cmr2 second palm domain-containing protein n=1 Tax=Aporhodopirellula aestuarii TaxID=2950107 RepID=A0ABT0U2E6_9BACT|nr:hypothetical protein [Aporhodopirellula aestuarii]MCM2371071.1 hypothetical protein [Aporhodopirellula aestuarii]